MKLNINNEAVVRHTNTLEKLTRSALPNAIRSTLNSVAFDVKQNTMPIHAEDEFDIRVPNFFKAKSRVEMARGFDVANMKSIVGFVGDDQAIKDLEAQEYGGTIESRSFIPMDPARAGGPMSKVRPNARISKIRGIVNSNTMSGVTPQQKFTKAVIKAGKGGHVIGNTPNQTLWRIESVSPVKKKALYSYEKGRDVQVSQTRFMRDASIESAHKMDEIYIREAEKQIARIGAK